MTDKKDRVPSPPAASVPKVPPTRVRTNDGLTIGLESFPLPRSLPTGKRIPQQVPPQTSTSGDETTGSTGFKVSGEGQKDSK